MDCWQILGMEATDDPKAVKRAYAALVKKHKPESDPEGYRKVRAAFDQALADTKNSNVRTPMHEEQAASSQLPLASNTQTPVTTTDDVWIDDSLPPAANISAMPNPGVIAAHEIVDALHESEENAIQLFLARLQDIHATGSVDDKQAFEHEILRQLYAMSRYPYPHQLADLAAESFHWHELSESHGDMVYATTFVAQCALAARTYDELFSLASLTSEHGSTKDEHIAANLLIAPFDAAKLTRFAKNGHIVEVVTGYIDDLDRNCADTLDQVLDPQTINWWRTTLLNPPVSIWRRVVTFASWWFFFRLMLFVFWPAPENAPDDAMGPSARDNLISVPLALVVTLFYQQSWDIGFRRFITERSMPAFWSLSDWRQSLQVRLTVLITLSVMIFTLPALAPPEPIVITLLVVAVILFAFTDHAQLLVHYSFFVIGWLCVFMLRDLTLFELDINSDQASSSVLLLVSMWAHVTLMAKMRSITKTAPDAPGIGRYASYTLYFLAMAAVGVGLGFTTAWLE